MTKPRRLQLAAIGIVLVTIVTRLPSLVHPLPIDGGQPYVDAVERKPPLLFWTYAAIFKMGGIIHAAQIVRGRTIFVGAVATGRKNICWGTRTANIYLDAQARPACRYILTFPLTGRIFGGPLYGVDMHRWIMPGAWNKLEQDFNKHPPTYTVDLRTDPDPRYQLKEFSILTKLLTERYQVVASTAEGVIYRMR
jgi:hypothetical protein